MNKRIIAALAVCVALLGGCGGGDQTELPLGMVQEQPASEPRLSFADLELMGPGLLTTGGLMHWAEGRFPQFFSPPNQPIRVFGSYEYRYYPGSENLLAVSGGDVYVMGPVTGNSLKRLGSLMDFQCLAKPQTCGVPGAPVMGSLTPQGTISFGAPSFDGGSPVLRYDGSCTDGSNTVTASSTSSPIAVTGLTIGTTYTCKVTATNSAGTSVPSSSLSVVARALTTPTTTTPITATPTWPFTPTPTAPTPSTPTAPTPVPATWTQRTTLQLQSDPGDYIAQGASYEYSRLNARIGGAYTASPNLFAISIEGDEKWTGQFKMPDGNSRIVPGTYSNVPRFRSSYDSYPSGASDWFGLGRACNAPSSVVTVNSAEYDSSGKLQALNLRFTQQCDGSTGALSGQLIYGAQDATNPPGPVNPPPPDLWKPNPGEVPASGSYLYIVSEPGDSIGGGQTYLYTTGNERLGEFARVNVSATSSKVTFGGGPTGFASVWTGAFVPMEMYTFRGPLLPGYYANLKLYTGDYNTATQTRTHNPAVGGLSIKAEGRSCESVRGWISLDEVKYVGGTVVQLRMRFEQYCNGAATAVRGQMKWRSPTWSPYPPQPW